MSNGKDDEAEQARIKALLAKMEKGGVFGHKDPLQIVKPAVVAKTNEPDFGPLDPSAAIVPRAKELNAGKFKLPQHLNLF